MLKVGVFQHTLAPYMDRFYQVLSNRSEIELTAFFATKPKRRYFVVVRSEGEPRYIYLKSIYIPGGSHFPIDLFPRMLTNDFDVIIDGYESFGALTSFRCSKLKSIPYIVYSESYEAKYRIPPPAIKKLGQLIITQMIARPVIKRADSFIVPVEVAKDFLVNLGADENKIHVIPNPIDVEIFRPGIKSDIRRKLKLEHKKVILYVGRLDLEKGVLDLLKCAKLLRERKDISFVFVGNGFLRSKLVELKTGWKEKNVIITGPVKELPCWYNIADIVVLPLLTKRDPGRGGLWCYPLSEAMACGKPVIYTKFISWQRGWDKRGLKLAYGIEVEEEKPEAIAEAIVTLLDNDKLRRKMGRNARKNVVKECSLENVAQKWIEVIRSVS